MTPTATTTLTRTVDGRSVPAAGRYQLDPNHSEVGFIARHLVVTKVRGRFERYDVDLTVADRVEDSTLEVRLDAASITTGNPDRDAHLRSADFFDVENHPQLMFRSTGVRNVSGDTWNVDGDLEIRGTSRPVTLSVEFHGEMTDPYGNAKLLATASTEINREDWGLTWNAVLETGSVVVSKKIQIEIEVQAVPA
jgi:polyisoprenoid-binding protein YceI